MNPLYISIVSLMVSIITSIFVYRQAKANEYQVKFAEINAKLPTTLELLKEFRSENFLKYRDYIKYELENDFPIDDNDYSTLSSNALFSARIISHFLDNLGLFVNENLVDKHIVSKFIGGEIEILYKILEPYIKKERAKGNLDYQKNFEELYFVCNSYSQNKILSKTFNKPLEDE